MSTTDNERFDKWYSKLKGLVTGGEIDSKGEDVDSCVRQLKADGHDEESAFRICNASIKGDLTDEERESALEIAEDVKSEEEPIGAAFERVVEAAGMYDDGEDEEDEKAEEDAADDVDQKAVGDDEWSATALTFRVLADPEDDTDYNDDVLGVGVSFPEAGVYVDWHREAFPDQLEEPHVSEYGTIEDLEQATGNVIEMDEEQKGGEGEVEQKAEPETRRVYLDHGVGTAPDDVTVKADPEEGLYYEAEVGSPDPR